MADAISVKAGGVAMTTETALIKVAPAQDSAVIALVQEAQRLAEYAEGRQVQSPEDVRHATEDLALIAGVRKAIELKRKEYVGPINDHLKTVNDAFKTISGPLEQADKTTRGKVLAYRQEEERRVREAEEINRLRMEAARREMELKGELSEPVGIVEVPPESPSFVRTGAGNLGTVKTRKWEVEDLTKVPLEYLMIDATRVGRVVRAGIPSISGIRIWEEEGLRVTGVATERTP